VTQEKSPLSRQFRAALNVALSRRKQEDSCREKAQKAQKIKRACPGNPMVELSFALTSPVFHFAFFAPYRSHHKQSKKEKIMNDIMKLCDVVRETAFAIHCYHKNGHLEKVYENALAHRLRKLGLDVKQQHPLKVYDEDGTLIGEYFADLFVENRLIVELKATKALADEHVAQVLGYLRAARIEHGLLLNFGAPRFAIKKYALSQAAEGSGIGGLTMLLGSLFAFFASFRG
jgi:GxxExxY protein